MTSRRRDRREPAGHARAGGGEVRPPGDAGSSRASGWRATRARWTARASWASCCSPRRAARRSRSPPTAPTSRRAVDALAALVEVGIRRGRMQRLTGIGVSPGVVSRPRGHSDPARAGAALPDRAGARRSRAGAARARAACRPREQLRRHPRQRRAAPRPGAGVALRRAAADARRSDAGAARRRARPRAARQRRVGACSRCSTSSAPSSTRSPIPTCASGRATSPIWSAGCG